MTPLIIIIALLAIAGAGAWVWRRQNRASKLAEQRATEESDRLATEARRDHEKAIAEANAGDDARLQKEAEERSRKEAEAKKNARLAEEQRLATEKRAAEAEAKRQVEEQVLAETQAREVAYLKAEAERRAETEARDKTRLAAEEEQRAEEHRQSEESARVEAETRERARIAAEEEARRQAEEQVEQEKPASEPVVEPALQEATAKAHAASFPPDEILSVNSEVSEPPLAEEDPLPMPREFSEPKPSPKKKTYTKREQKSDSTPRENLTSPIRLQLVFGRGSTVKTLALVPHRRDEMPNSLEVTTANGRLSLSEWSEDAYQPVEVSKFPDSLMKGLVWQAREGGRRWRWELTRREIYVLAAGDEFGLHGFVTRRIDQRLWLNTRHVVLANESLRDQILAALAEAGCAAPEVCDTTTPGVPPGWILFRDVIPTQAVQMREDRDPLNVLCPAHEIEPHFVGGVRLERNAWLAGYPPRIRFTGQLANGFEVLIDDQRAEVATDGAYQAPGWDAEGEHRLWFGGQAVTYVLRTMQEKWECWHAHDFGTGAAICGASTHKIDGARWQQVRIPAANPLLLGARPGEIFCCQPRHDVRSETILALVPFAPIWALPLDPVHADKRSARVVFMESSEPAPSVEHGNRKLPKNHDVRRWFSAINDAGRKQLALSVEGADAKTLWQRYRAAAKRLWKLRRKAR